MEEKKYINGAIVIPKIRKKSYYVAKTIAYIVLISYSIIILLPFLIAIIASITPNTVLNQNGFQFISGYLDISNYQTLLTTDTYGNIFQCLLNTFIYIIPTLFIGMFFSCLAAYAFARIDFKGKNIAFYLMLSTMVIPGIIITFPSYLLFVDIYKVQEWFPLFPIIIPGMFGSVGTMFFLKQYFETLPRDLEEAAEMDGMNRFSMFIRIIVPLSIPAIITQLLLGFNGAYNDYLTPLLYIGGDTNLYTMQLFVKGLDVARNKSYPLILSGALLALVPTLILYLSGQKFFVEGIAMTGIK